MINLLPYDIKRDVRSARTNTTLVNYIVILCLGIAFLCIISFVVYIVLITTKTNAEALVAENASKSTAYLSVQAEANVLRARLASAKPTLDKAVDYTKVITGIANVVPAGVVLESLNLSPLTFGVPITLQAYAKTTEAALALKDNFKKSVLFSNVSFQSLTTSSSQDGYPLTVTLNLTINMSAVQ